MRNWAGVFKNEKFQYFLIASLAFMLMASKSLFMEGMQGGHDADLGIVHRITLGQVPYRDFNWPTSPWIFFCLAILFKIFGSSYLVSALHTSIQCAVLAVMILWLCRRVFGLDSLKSVFLSFAGVLWSPHFIGGRSGHSSEVQFLMILGACCLAQAVSGAKRALLWSLACGAACAMAFWTKQDLGAGALAGVFTALFIHAVLTRSFVWRLWAGFASGAALVFAAFLFYLYSHGALAAMWKFMVVRALEFRFIHAKGYYGDLNSVGAGFLVNRLLYPWWPSENRMTAVLLVITAAAIVLSFLRLRAGANKAHGPLTVSVFCFASFYAMVFTHWSGGYSSNATTIIPALAILWMPWAKDYFGLQRYFRWAASVLIVAVGLYAVRFIQTADLRKLTYPMREGPLKGFYVMESDGLVINEASEYVRKNIPAEQNFFSPNIPLIYFVTGRNVPFPCDVTDFGFHDDDMPWILDEIEKNKIAWALYRKPFNPARPLNVKTGLGWDQLNEYLIKNFEFFEERNHFVVLRRKSA